MAKKQKIEPINHHWVPRVYLKNFAYQKDTDKFIVNVFDKVTSKQFLKETSDIASEKNFNTVDNKEDKLFWEKYYCEKIEKNMPKVFNEFFVACKLAGNNSDVISTKLKRKIAEIIIPQLFRTKKSRARFNEVAEASLQKYFQEMRTESAQSNNKKKKLTEDSINKIRKSFLNEKFMKNFELAFANDPNRMERFIKPLLVRYWVIYKNTNHKVLPFVTSDHPVVFYNMVSKSTTFNDNGLARAETLILFPINSKFVIALGVKEMFPNTDKFVVVDEKFVTFLNSLQLKQCNRQVYWMDEATIKKIKAT